jgi:hypothetical protein
MELREQPARPTLAQRLGDVTHVSPLLRRVQVLSGCSRERVGDWLLKCAVQRGATHYRRRFDPALPADTPELTNEEIGISLCLAHHSFDPIYIRAAAQLLSAPEIDPEEVVRLAVMERCEPVLAHIAQAAGRVAPQQQPWAFVREHLPKRHRGRTTALPHWSRFVAQTGYTPSGRGEHIEWLTRDE